MRKLKLNLEALVVETFGTGHAPAQRGTVYGRATDRCNTNWSCEGTCGPRCETNTCVETYDFYCTPGSCGTSCNLPCVDTCDAPC